MSQADLPLSKTSLDSDDPYFTKLGQFYSEWVELNEENEKSKQRVEPDRPYRFCWVFCTIND